MLTGDKLNLIYVASIGHSGSTLLESMLGAHTRIATTGEVHIWPHEIEQGGVMPCICGLEIPDCPFWNRMLELANPLNQPHPQIHFFREAHNAGHTIRPSRLREFSARKLSADLTEQIATYGRNNREVMAAFATVMSEQYGADTEWVVDASKDPYRLLWLARSGQFNLKVLHVVRNPRSFSYSMIKRLPDNGINIAHKRLYETARQSAKWSVENHLISLVAKNHLSASDHILVNYEDLASDPAATFKRVCDTVGCEFEQQAVDNFRDGSIHTIAGNPMRYRQGGIVLDEKWKKALPRSSRRLSEVMTAVNRSRFGY